ncbi:MAG TPA: hypothetical protein VF371_08320, partial [Candidatus Limnocylindrales bacterium]
MSGPKPTRQGRPPTRKAHGRPPSPEAPKPPRAAADPGVTAPEPATEATGLTAAEAAQRLRTDGP